MTEPEKTDNEVPNPSIEETEIAAGGTVVIESDDREKKKSKSSKKNKSRSSMRHKVCLQLD